MKFCNYSWTHMWNKMLLKLSIESKTKIICCLTYFLFPNHTTTEMKIDLTVALQIYQAGGSWIWLCWRQFVLLIWLLSTYIVTVQVGVDTVSLIKLLIPKCLFLDIGDFSFLHVRCIQPVIIITRLSWTKKKLARCNRQLRLLDGDSYYTCVMNVERRRPLSFETKLWWCYIDFLDMETPLFISTV